jgi:hypothetical protein
VSCAADPATSSPAAGISPASRPLTRSTWRWGTAPAAAVTHRQPGPHRDCVFSADHPRRALATVRQGGPRSPQPGAPYTYVTTKQFLSHFGFDTLRDLPDMEQLEDAGLLSKQKLLAGALPGDLGETPDLINMEEGRGDFETDEPPLVQRFVNSTTAFVDPRPLAALSAAIAMLGLPRTLLTFLIALVASQFVGLAWAEPATDRPFFVRWANTWHNKHLADAAGPTTISGVCTRDGGTHWEARPSGTYSYLLNVHFVDTGTGWAVGYFGTILATRDGGIHWEPQTSGTNNDLNSVDLSTRTPAGRSGTAGRSWRRTTAGPTGRTKPPEPTMTSTACILPTRTLGWAVGDHGTILATRDGGAHWENQTTGTNYGLNSEHFAIYAPLIETFEVAPDGVDELHVSLRLKPDPGAVITAAHVSARLGEDAAWTLLGGPTKFDDRHAGSELWQLKWRPKKIGADAGAIIEYQVRLDDGGPPFEILLGTFSYDPWWASLWRENEKAVIGARGAFAIFVIYAGSFGFVLFLAPARLASVGGAPGLDADMKLEGWGAPVWKLGRSLLESVRLPSLSRHPRVRHASTALYRDGNAKLDDLGKAARTSFVVEPEVLDARVNRAASNVERPLNQLELFNRRQIYVAFPVRVGEIGPIIDRPGPETLRPFVRPGSSHRLYRWHRRHRQVDVGLRDGAVGLCQWTQIAEHRCRDARSRLGRPDRRR